MLALAEVCAILSAF